MENTTKILTKPGLELYDSESKKFTQKKLDEKVDKIDGKGLSTNDFTNDDKEKLDSLTNNIRVQSDWEQIDSSGQDYIKNKPFGEVNVAITFDGNLTDKSVILLEGKQYVHVSDLYISQELLNGMTIKNNLDTTTTIEDISVITQYNDSIYGYKNDDNDILFVSVNNAVYESVTFTKRGTYFFYSADNTVAQTVSLTKNEITKIDSKYLPGSALTNEQVLSLIDRVNELEKGIAKFG